MWDDEETKRSCLLLDQEAMDTNVSIKRSLLDLDTKMPAVIQSDVSALRNWFFRFIYSVFCRLQSVASIQRNSAMDMDTEEASSGVQSLSVVLPNQPDEEEPPFSVFPDSSSSSRSSNENNAVATAGLLSLANAADSAPTHMDTDDLEWIRPPMSAGSNKRCA